MKKPTIVYEIASARFDAERVYRYSLVRAWGHGPTVLWIMLNPSTADEHVLDPTLRRCEGFTQQWGYDGFEVVNLFALRSTDQKLLRRHPAPIGERQVLNDMAILLGCERASLIVCAWGKLSSTVVADRAARVRDLLDRRSVEDRTLFRLGKPNQDGSPRHPLYLPANTEMEHF